LSTPSSAGPTSVSVLNWDMPGWSGQNDTPALTKGYAFFVPMDDWMARQRAVLDLIWFHLEDE